MPQKIFKGEEIYGVPIECDIVIIGDEAEVFDQASDHLKSEHEIDNPMIVTQTMRDYNESTDGSPQSCSYS